MLFFVSRFSDYFACAIITVERHVVLFRVSSSVLCSFSLLFLLSLLSRGPCEIETSLRQIAL